MSYFYNVIENVDVATFDDAVKGSMINSAVFSIVPVQSGSGDPSPDNIRPITGLTGANICRTGKNLYDEVTYPLGSGYVNAITGDTRSNSSWKRTDEYIPCEMLRGKRITINTLETTSLSAGLAFYDNTKTYISGVLCIEYAGGFVVPSNASYLRFTVPVGTINVQMEFGTENTSYEPYQTPTTAALDWSDYGTIYGGYVDITNGTLVITHANIASYDDEEINEPWISSMDAYSPGATPTTGAQVVYPLKPPIEISIPAVPIEILDGVNNIWSDVLTIKKLTYRVDNETFYRRYDYIMNNPGYYLLDGGGIDLSSGSSQSITGSWNRTVTAIKTNKPIFAYNIKYGSGKPLTPVPVFCRYITATQAVIVGATLHIIVNSDDSCVVQDVATAARSLGAIEKAAAEIPAVEEEVSLEEETSNNE